MRSRILLFTTLLMLLLMWATAPVSAISGRAVISFTVTCEYMEVTHTAGSYDRDNTGHGVETITGTITDGAGNLIQIIQGSAVVGVPILPGSFFMVYSDIPVANPIHLVLVSIAGNGYEEQVIWDVSGDCDLLPPSSPPPPASNTSSAFAGVGIPAGFVMHHIACTTPVYTEPAGVPVGDDRVLAGQTWYVDPTPVEGADGKQWTEIFVGSAINPWIPTECVGA